MPKLKHFVGNPTGPEKHILLRKFRVKGKATGEFTCSYCGNVFEAQLGHIVRAKHSSCGCMTNIWRGNSGRLDHGLCGTPYHNAWRNMHSRCTNPKVPRYPHYGGRGIKICERWKDVTLFKEDIDKQLEKQGLTLEDWGQGKDRYSVDRKDNDGDYEPSNIRFSTPTEQNSNK